jgi:hypothetical protein
MYTSGCIMSQESFLNNLTNHNSSPSNNQSIDVRDELDIILRGQNNYENSLENLFEHIDTSQQPTQPAIRMAISQTNPNESQSLTSVGYEIQSEVAKAPPPSYQDVFRSDDSPMSDVSGDICSNRLTPNSNSNSQSRKSQYRPTRPRSGPYEKYKDESGKIKVDEISDPAERERVLEKREKNRVAAEKARYKKRIRIDELEREKQKIEEVIAAEDIQLSRIKMLLGTLRVAFQEHDRVCRFKK